MTLTPTDKERYRRHILLPEIGGQGQQALNAAKVLVIGAGGLGCPILLTLTSCGIGHLGICDGDKVELSNLNRQTLYGPSDIGRAKVDAAKERLTTHNPETMFTLYPEHMTDETVDDFLAPYDLIIEGLDRYAPRYTLNAACRRLNKPWMSSAVGRFNGQVALFDPRDASSACYACLVPEAPEDEALCETDGILGSVTGLVGTLAAHEAIKHICGMAPSLLNSLLIFDGKTSTTRRVGLPKDPECAVCGSGT